MNELPNNIKRVALVAVWGFLLMALVFGYWQVVRAPALRAHPNNPHAQQRAKSIKPGLIYTRDSKQGLDVVLTIDSKETARQVAGIVQLSVEEGTASSVALSGYRVAANTSWAQNPEGKPHSWTLGFAPVEAPQAAVAVIVESSVPGRAAAGPIARQILEVLLSSQ